jgi:hypothetical protein
MEDEKKKCVFSQTSKNTRTFLYELKTTRMRGGAYGKVFSLAAQMKI